MKRATHLPLLLVLVTCAATWTACTAESELLPGSPAGGSSDGGPGDSITPPVCAAGRSYALFDGRKLEEERASEHAGRNRARIKPYATLSGEYQRVLGLVPASLAASASSFNEPPARWLAEADYSGVSLNALFSISYEGCMAFTKTPAEYGVAPTAESAYGVCRTLMRKAWSRSASSEEIAACQELATTKLAREADPRRRWAYVCASILSSSKFLAF